MSVMPFSKPVISSKFSRPPLDSWLILSFIIPFAVYMMTLAPSVTFFDSGEFITATASLGSAHSPGYPLFLMYAKLFNWLPVGNIAFRVNMATAFSSSLACLTVYLAAERALRGDNLLINEKFTAFVRKTAALSAALAFAFSPRLWLQSNHDKPYPLLAFITGVSLYMMLRWRERYFSGEETPAYIYCVCYLSGLAVGLHQTIILIIPVWVVMALITDWRVITRFRELIIATAFGFWGLATQLYLPLRAITNPLLNWGDTRNWGQFLWHFLRKGYPAEPHTRDMKMLWAQLKAFSVPHEFTWLGVLLLLFAMYLLWKKRKDLFFGYLAAVTIFLAVIAGYFNTIPELVFLTEEFFTPLYLFTAVLLAFALYGMIDFAVSRSVMPEIISFKINMMAAILMLVLPTAMIVINYYENDQHENYIAFDYAENSLRSLPQNAVMFTWGDSGAFPLWYLQGIEKMREDVDLPHTPHLVFDWYIRSMPRLFKETPLPGMSLDTITAEMALGTSITYLLDRRPIFIDFSTRYSINFSDFIPAQQGIIYRVRKTTQPVGIPDVSIFELYNNRGLLEKQSFLDLDTGKAILIYANSYLEIAEFLLGSSKNQEGLKFLQMSEAVSPEMRPMVNGIMSRYGMKGRKTNDQN